MEKVTSSKEWREVFKKQLISLISGCKWRVEGAAIVEADDRFWFEPPPLL